MPQTVQPGLLRGLFHGIFVGERPVTQMDAVKVLLRAQSGAGKTGLLNQVFAECGICPVGLRTARYFDNGHHFGYDLAVLSTGEKVQMVRGEPCVPGMRPAPQFFDERVRPLLLQEAQQHGLLLVDEVGRFEKHDAQYLDTLRMLWHSERPMVLVLKKEPLPFNEDVWKGGEGALKIDLDTENQAEAAEKLSDVFGKGVRKEKPFACIRWEMEDFDAAQAGIGRLKAFQQAHPGEGAAFVRSRNAAVRALAADAGLIPVQGEWPALLMRKNARVIAFEMWDGRI